MISWMKMLPVAKIMFDGLCAVLRTKTDQSNIGQITEDEIKTVILKSVPNVVVTLGPMVVRKKEYAA